MTTVTPHLVIIGGGMTGTAAFIAAVRHRFAKRIDIVDPLPIIGTGTAFSASSPVLLCNTSVAITSLLADQPDDFYAYLHNTGRPVTRDDFVPRSWMTEYARDRYLVYRSLHERRGGEHRHLTARAVAVVRDARPRDEGSRYRVELDNGEVVEATCVFVGHGHGEPRVPEVLQPHLGQEGIFRGLFPEDRLLQALPPRARVLVLGTRLSGIDAALLLCGSGHHVTMASPSGGLPAVRTRTGRKKPGLVRASDIAALETTPDATGAAFDEKVKTLVRSVIARISPRPLEEQISSLPGVVDRLRAEIRLAEQGRTDWQDALCAFVDAANDALPRRPSSVRDAAMRLCQGPVARYLAAFPLANAKRLLRYIESGRLVIRSGVPLDIRRHRHWLVTWQDASQTPFDAIVTAAGYHIPKLHAQRDRIDLVNDPSKCCTPPTVHAELDITLPGASTRENIWLLGISSSIRIPSINAIYPMAQQVHRVCRESRATTWSFSTTDAIKG
ncbi:FAD/NAD(P)-binding protein [Pendulispora brunnea]|uniref:FAD/NAD(P)-binding protein n=1 Tax=Pendulispora brunnea TaxID=2905690 RepID=A0ABZ2JZE1_9BACT